MDLTSEFKDKYFMFENEAFEYGKTLMEEAFDVTDDVELLYSSFGHTDFEHYWRHLVKAKTSTKDEFDNVWKNFINGGIKNSIQAVPLPTNFNKEKNKDLSITVV